MKFFSEHVTFYMRKGKTDDSFPQVIAAIFYGWILSQVKQ